MWWNPMTWLLPSWAKSILDTIVDLLKAILTKVGKEALRQIQAKIIEVATMDISGDEKRNLVVTYALSLLPGIGRSALNLLIEGLYNKLKDEKVV